MTELLQNHIKIHIHQHLYEKMTTAGNTAVYQTTPYGLVLTLNGHILLSEQDSFFYHEMMTHPALFTHPRPQSVAIVGHHYGILQEVLKHPHVTQVHCIPEAIEVEEAVSRYFPALEKAKRDPRVHYHAMDPASWIQACQTETFDVVIQNQSVDGYQPEHYPYLFSLLRPEGILMQPCPFSLFELTPSKPLFQTLEHAGFPYWQLLHFPQPSYPTGWRVTIMAMKYETIKRVREKDVFNRNFTTRYYNFDTHKAALAMPEFMRAEWDNE